MIKLVMFILGGIFFLGIAWWIDSSGTIRTYKDEDGNPLAGSLSEKILVEINGADNGFFINSRDVTNPVLLLISSGLGTDDYFLTERFSNMHLDDIFTMVYWDYRGMGIAYDSDMDPKEITEEVLLQDTHAVTAYLKERFGQEKIYLMAFSGGTKIGIKAAEAFPEDYYAYIGMAQIVTDSSERDQLMYDFMKQVFTNRRNKNALKKLDSLVTAQPDGSVKCKKWAPYVYLLHKAGGGTTYNETEFWGIDLPIMLSHCYTIPEKLHYVPAMRMYRETTLEEEIDDFDFRNELTHFEIPMYFLSGEYDYNCPWPLVEDYCEKISAPEKGFYKIQNAAHSPLWENAEDCFEIMEAIQDRGKHR